MEVTKNTFKRGDLVDAVGEVAVVLSCENGRVQLLRGREDSTGHAQPDNFHMFADLYWPEPVASAVVTERTFDSGTYLFSVLLKNEMDGIEIDELDAVLLRWDKFLEAAREAQLEVTN